eukprot:NODE_644_length_2019_cov_28.180711_g595_i0.p1 GENE.NODE_644_length_2019_cov_28.180711_g595_i0~~NODE_644_length_2019_cov_28.180711_g595_i0.p1  ORF type:complete len:428 (-),score=73.93 NODE_644_length_2019_cov_28.180711_g595_i0:570-1853(-)
MVNPVADVDELEFRQVAALRRWISRTRLERTFSPMKRKIRRVWWIIWAIARMRVIARANLTPTERAQIKEIYDSCGGMNSATRIREVLMSCGQCIMDSEVGSILHTVAYREGFVLQLEQFMSIMQLLKQRHRDSQDSDMGDAFVALGGNRDRSGEISAGQLRQVVRYFDLQLDLEKLIEEGDTNQNGLIEFDEFSNMIDFIGDAPTPKFQNSTEPVTWDSEEAIVGGWWKVRYRTHIAEKQPEPVPSPPAFVDRRKSAYRDDFRRLSSGALLGFGPRHGSIVVSSIPIKSTAPTKPKQQQQQQQLRRKSLHWKNLNRKTFMTSRANLDDCVVVSTSAPPTNGAGAADAKSTSPQRSVRKRTPAAAGVAGRSFPTRQPLLSSLAKDSLQITGGPRSAPSYLLRDIDHTVVLARPATYSASEKVARWIG